MTSGGVMDPQALPLVARRGLWDKFAGPGSVEAVTRGYRRGVPSVLVCADTAALETVAALAGDPSVNPTRQPLYLIVGTLPAHTTPLLHLAGCGVETYAVTAQQEGRSPWPLYRWTGSAWTLAGRYVPTSTSTESLRAADFSDADYARQLVLTEAANVSGPDDDGWDAGRLVALQSLAGPRALLVRVSDFVEFDLLVRQQRAA